MKQILVVDDSKTIRTICEWLYKGLDDKLLTADSIASAQALIESDRPDLIVLDYTMPDGDSYEYCKRLKGDAHTSKVPILFLGGKHANVDVDKAKASGADDVLIKPFKSVDFFTKIEQLLELAPEQSSPKPVVSDFSAPRSTMPVMTALSKPDSRTSSESNPAQPRRFNFPISGLAPVASPDSHETPPKQVAAVPPLKPLSSETPKTPLPSVSPAVTASTASIDPEILRAEIQAAVKEILPGVVRGVLKKLIVTEVTPQIQSWVDARVEALIKKMVR